MPPPLVKNGWQYSQASSFTYPAVTPIQSVVLPGTKKCSIEFYSTKRKYFL
jgi:hypothetical protein